MTARACGSLFIALALFGAAAECRAADLTGEVERVAIGHHRDPASLVRLRDALEAGEDVEPRLERVLALARLWFITGDRASTPEAKRDAYDRARQFGRRACELAPTSAAAHFWATASTARWASTLGLQHTLSVLPELRRGIKTVLELDPRFTRGYALAGSFAYEVPLFLGGSVTTAEEMFRKGLALDPHFTAVRLGLARSLLRQGRVDEAKEELRRVVAERTPTNAADWTLDDVPEAQRLLDTIR
jgi:tetratricopeptide (TPR) repeat protein